MGKKFPRRKTKMEGERFQVYGKALQKHEVRKSQGYVHIEKNCPVGLKYGFVEQGQWVITKKK